MSDTITIPCVYDANGNIYSIGPWDYMYFQDLEGNLIARSPFPENCIVKDTICNVDEHGVRTPISTTSTSGL